MAKTACIFGSTGLTGSHLLKILINDERYEKIILFNRTVQSINHSKIEQIVADYNSIDQYTNQLKADEYYCCLGTTIKKAKTKQAFEYVDLQLPVIIGKFAIQNKVSGLFVVSSIGASAKSSNFYLNVKGRMEEELQKSGIGKLFIFRPSMLIGERNESRFGETVGKIVMKFIGFLFLGKLKKYRAIKAEIVANAMVVVANGGYNSSIFESDEIQKLGFIKD
jgi:uncharacterized protein YbjT (DUF2867 family)